MFDSVVNILRVAILIFFGATGSAIADGYSILRGDRILLRAGWWDHATLQYHDWAGVSGEYAVDPQGKINVPLAGHIEAAGTDVEALSTALSHQIQRRLGLTGLPEIAIEIIGHTPIYISGSVNSPGEYAFRRSMIVRQAVSLAGGIGYGPGEQVETAEREAIRLGGNLRVLTTRLAALKDERARLVDEIEALEAQANGELPVAGTSSTGLEKEIFDARRRSTDVRSRNIQELQTVIGKRLERLDEEVALRREQLEIARGDVEAMETLKERGLAVRSRETAVLTSVANMEAQLIQLEVARLEAEQQLNLARRDEITLYDEARLGRLARLKEVELDLATVRTEEETARSLYADALARSNVSPEDAGELVTHYVVTRITDTGTDRIVADPSTPLMPGDTLEIMLEVIEPRLEN